MQWRNIKQVNGIEKLKEGGDAAMSNEVMKEGFTKKVIIKHLKKVREVALWIFGEM